MVSRLDHHRLRPPTTRCGRTRRSYRLTQDRFAELLADHAEADHLHARLLEAERRNLGHYGFGIKGFMLSMIDDRDRGDRGPSAAPA